MQNKFDQYIKDNESKLPIAGFVSKDLKKAALKKKTERNLTWDEILEISLKIFLGIPPEKSN